MIEPIPPRRLRELRRMHYASFADYDPNEFVLHHAWSFFTEQPQARWYDGRCFVAVSRCASSSRGYRLDLSVRT